MFRLTLNRGFGPLQIIFHDNSRCWRAHKKPVDRTTAFYVALTHLECLTDAKKTGIIKAFLGHCECFDAVVSEGVDVMEWANNCSLFYQQQETGAMGRSLH